MGLPTFFWAWEYPRIVNICVKMRKKQDAGLRSIRTRNWTWNGTSSCLEVGGSHCWCFCEWPTPSDGVITWRWRHNRKFWKWSTTFATDWKWFVLTLWVILESFGSIAQSDRTGDALFDDEFMWSVRKTENRGKSWFCRLPGVLLGWKWCF